MPGWQPAGDPVSNDTALWVCLPGSPTLIRRLWASSGGILNKESIKRQCSHAYRWLITAREVVRGLRQHADQRGSDLPSLSHRIIEQARLLRLSGLTPTNYYRYRLYRKDLSLEQKATFLGFFEGWRWMLAVNGPGTSPLVTDKVILSRILSAAGVSQPECIGIFGLPGGLLDDTSSRRSKSEFEQFLSAPNRENFFLKPIYGRKGAGHFSVGACIKEGQEWELLPRKERVTAAELIEKVTGDGTPYMAQERMVPHPDLNCFGTDVLHTIRFITVLDGETEIAQAALKIGAGNTAMDNTLKGNLIAGIDLTSGVLRSGLAMDMSGPIPVPKPANRHPVTQSEIGGHQLPLWQETLDLVKKAARCFHPLAVLAWDVAITSKGPVIVEANPDPDLFLTQMPNDEGLLATPLGDYLYRHGLLDQLGVGSGLQSLYERRAAK